MLQKVQSEMFCDVRAAAGGGTDGTVADTAAAASRFRPLRRLKPSQK